MIAVYDGQTSATTEVDWFELLVPVLVNDSVWDTKSITSGVPDTYIKPDATINGVSVFVPFIRVDYDGEEAIGPKWLVP